MKSTFFFILIMIIFLTGCEKPYIPCDPSNPDCIYAVCRVDGERWGMSCEREGIFGCSAADVQYYRYTGSNNIYIYIKNEARNSAIKVRAKSVESQDQIYPLLAPGKIISFYTESNNASLCSTYKMDTTLHNYILLNEIDTINRIVAGEFEFTGQDTCGKVVHITDGRFRLNYRF